MLPLNHQEQTVVLSKDEMPMNRIWESSQNTVPFSPSRTGKSSSLSNSVNQNTASKKGVQICT